MRDVINAGAVDAIEATVAAGASPQVGPQVVADRDGPAAPTRRGVDSKTAGDHARSRWPGSRRWWTRATINDKLARQVFEGVHRRARARPRGRSTQRGLEVVSDEGALGAAVDEAIAANPDIADKIRGGKVAGRRSPDRRGDEGDARPGRRGPGPALILERADLTASMRP